MKINEKQYIEGIAVEIGVVFKRNSYTSQLKWGFKNVKTSHLQIQRRLKYRRTNADGNRATYEGDETRELAAGYRS